jgi:hypothetical protein
VCAKRGVLSEDAERGIYTFASIATPRLPRMRTSGMKGNAERKEG